MYNAVASVASIGNRRNFFIVLLLCFTLLSSSTPSTHTHHPKPIAKGVDLRILPLGDSITWGEGSTDENGYRLALSNLITNNGNKLNFIGSVKSGTMANNENEGHGGYQIVPVGLTGKPDYLLRPNVVLFMAGTNDIVFDVDLANAPTRLGAVVEGIVTECPDAAILVGSLTPLLNPGWMSKIHDFNAAVPGVLSKLANGGKHVALVDMSRVNSSHIHTSDGIHPTDEAYALIAAAWYEGMVEAGKRGWIQKPVPLPGASQSPPSATSSPEGKSNSDGAREGNQDSKLFNDLPIKSTCTLNQIMVSCAVLLGLIVLARKMIAVFLRRYRV